MLLAVSIVKKTYLPKDPASEQYEDYISLAFAYENEGTKPMRAFQGDATFLDTFGDSIYSAHLKVDMIVCHNAGPGLTDTPHLYRERRGLRCFRDQGCTFLHFSHSSL